METTITFAIDADQTKLINQWQDDCRKRAIEKQKANPPESIPLEVLESSWETGYPYGGAIGGGLVYSFCRTSLGTIVKVRDEFLGETLDVTDYEAW